MTVRQRTSARMSAVVGGGVWLVLVISTGVYNSFFRTIEQMLWLAVLVIVPLGLDIVVRALAADSAVPLLRWALRLQPLAAALAVGSFWLPVGVYAALAALPWAAVCALMGAAGLVQLLAFRRWRVNPSRLLATGALTLLPVGGVALLQSRWGATPLGFSEPIVLLTAIHFHYTAFAGSIFAACLRLTLRGSSERRRAIFAPIAVALLAASPLLALGWVLGIEVVKMAAVGVLTVSLLAIAGLTLIELRCLRPWPVQLLLALAAISVIGGMLLAALYGLSELTGNDWVTIPRMAHTHGLLNGLGFSLLGLTGWALWEPPAGKEQ